MMKIQSLHRIFALVALITARTAYAFTTTQVKSSETRGIGLTSPGATSSSQYDRIVGLDASVKMAPILGANARLSRNRAPLSSKTRIQQSSVPLEFPRTRRFPYFNGGDVFNGRDVVLMPRLPTPTAEQRRARLAKKFQADKARSGITKMDAALFATYFCNIMVVNLSVVTVPALAAEHFSNPQAIAAFVAGVASMAPLGGGFGKIINGFVCQRLGANRSSWMYLMGLSLLSMGMSATKSLAPIGLTLIGFEFLSSIQWTSISSVLQQHYSKKPELLAKGISILSLSSTCGALAAKTIGAGLLQATNWRTVTQIGAVIALLGSLAMKTGVTDLSKSVTSDLKPVQSTKEAKSPIDSLKSVLGSKVFWMIGLAHSLGMVAKGTDRFLGAFIQDVSGLPAHVCAVLTSSVTVGMLFGLVKGKKFAALDSVTKKMKMLKGNYRMAIASTLGLATCGVARMGQIFGNPLGMASLVTLLSGFLASAVAFQFYQIPNLVSSTSFATEDAPVALSLIDAVGFFATAQLFTAFSGILGKLGWSASWGFFAMVFGIGSTLMTNAIKPVLIESKRRTA